MTGVMSELADCSEYSNDSRACSASVGIGELLMLPDHHSAAFHVSCCHYSDILLHMHNPASPVTFRSHFEGRQTCIDLWKIGLKSIVFPL